MNHFNGAVARFSVSELNPGGYWFESRMLQIFRSKFFAVKNLICAKNEQTDKQTYDTRLSAENKSLGPVSPGLAAKILLH